MVWLARLAEPHSGTQYSTAHDLAIVATRRFGELVAHFSAEPSSARAFEVPGFGFVFNAPQLVFGNCKVADAIADVMAGWLESGYSLCFSGYQRFSGYTQSGR
jgi:hypothetical protein